MSTTPGGSWASGRSGALNKEGSGFRVLGCGFWVLGFGFRVQGLGQIYIYIYTYLHICICNIPKVKGS